MALIKFKDLPDTSTPLNASNLNNNFDAVHPIESVLITNTNTNPAEILGGTWELIDKGFKELRAEDAGSGTYFSKNTNNVDSYSIYFTRKDSTITMRIMVKNKVAIADDKIILGNILYEALGLSRIYFSAYSHLGATDGGNAVVQCNLMYDTGELSANDILHKTTGSSVAVGSEIYFEFTINAPMEFMLDSACDKFYWKRTA